MGSCLRPDDGGAADLMYEAYRERADCPSRERFMADLAAWELVYAVRDGQVMGVVARKGGAIHIGISKAWRGKWATRSMIRQMIEWAGETGKVWTGVCHSNNAGARLVLGTGFRKVSDEIMGAVYAHDSK